MTDQHAGIERLSAKQEQRKQRRQSGPTRFLPPPDNPMAVARLFAEVCCTHDQVLTLRYWCGSWWTWRTTHWLDVEERTIRALLYRFAEHALYTGSDGFPKEWKPTRHKVRDLIEALGSLVILSDEFRQPCWLDHRVTGPIVAVQNGLLDITTRTLHPHTPLYFGHVSVPFPYQADAPRPEHFLTFLDGLWPQDPEAIDTLGEWFGYIIGGRTNLHKILLMIGPTRSGKGAIARALTQLIGGANTCSPTLNSIGSEFGLAPLIGKGLAVIADARFNGRDASTVVERLLSISGEDAQTINRKYREAWTGRLASMSSATSCRNCRMPLTH
jgi:putative DNA primase/helicase